MRKLIAANWKMNGRRQMAHDLAAGVARTLADKPALAEVVLCPSFAHLELCRSALQGSGVGLGAQDCSVMADGAYTGDVSAAMLKDMGCGYVILGHSERRAYHNEQDNFIADKMLRAHGAGLSVIVCVGEKNAGMDHDARVNIIKIQLRNSLAVTANASNTVIAYEPVWAIGSGLTPSSQQISEMHQVIRTHLPQAMQGARILYGGSVKADNAAAILSLKGVDGALVGGASLDLKAFLSIVAAAN